MDGKFSIAKSSDQFNFVFYDQYEGAAIGIVVMLAILYGEVFVLAFRRIYGHQIYPVGYKQFYLPKDFARSLIRYIVDIVCKLTIFGLVVFLTYHSAYNWSWFKSAINE